MPPARGGGGGASKDTTAIIKFHSSLVYKVIIVIQALGASIQAATRAGSAGFLPPH